MLVETRYLDYTGFFLLVCHFSLISHGVAVICMMGTYFMKRHQGNIAVL